MIGASADSPRDDRRRVAAVVTQWTRNSHADVLLSRILEPSAWGHERPFRLQLVGVYTDQTPPNELSRAYCERHRVPIFPSVRGAIGLGTDRVAVDGVLIIAEHGSYPNNTRGQQMYPRRRLFEQVVDAFRSLGGRVPVFSDKHLSYDWLLARWMYDLARHEGIPFMAGSSVPTAWRLPPLALPMDAEITEALAVGYSSHDAYGFHALEGLQCMTERRQGGETGVVSVRCLSGPMVWERLGEGSSYRKLLDELEPSRRKADPTAPDLGPRRSDVLFEVNYRDGLKASVAMIDSAGRCFAYTGRRRGVDTIDATVFDLESERPYGHFGHLLRAVEHMILNKEPAYPVERTLLTSGILAAALQSKSEGGVEIATPHLAEIRYTPKDWPFAEGPCGTPA